jgi:hypothetical protein
MYIEPIHAKAAEGIEPGFTEPPRCLRDIITPQRVATWDHNVNPYLLTRCEVNDTSATTATHDFNSVKRASLCV